MSGYFNIYALSTCTLVSDGMYVASGIIGRLDLSSLLLLTEVKT